MTRKHFELIASVLKKHLAYCDEQAGRAAADFLKDSDITTSRAAVTRWNEREKAVQAVTASLAAEFETVNPNFSQSRFLKACQPEVVEG
jgi:hypothetical protein